MVEGCYLMRNRFRAQEVWERMGFDVEECLEFTEHSPVQQAFRALLFSRIVPCVKDIGLWGEKVQRAYTDLGVLDAADSDLEALMRDDENIAERIEQEHAAEFAARKAEVDAAITAAEASCIRARRAPPSRASSRLSLPLQPHQPRPPHPCQPGARDAPGTMFHRAGCSRLNVPSCRRGALLPWARAVGRPAYQRGVLSKRGFQTAR